MASPPADPEVHAQVLLAAGSAFLNVGKASERLAASTAALALAREDRTRADAFISRAFTHLLLGQIEPALADSEQATALCRRLGPEALSFALVAESQAHMDAGQLDLAEDRLDEARQIGADMSHRYSTDGVYGDLALARKQPREAALRYGLALEQSEQCDNDEELYLSLIGVARALAMNHDDVAALEVAGMAVAHARDVGAPDRPIWPIPGRDPLPEAETRLGNEAAAQAKQRGMAVDIGYRVIRACELARSRQPASPKPE